MKPKRIGREISCLKNLFSRNVENNETIRFVNEITSANIVILGFIAKNQNTDIYQKTIEENFSITKSTTSKILKLMEQNGLIKRLGVDGDARLKQIVLTEKGHAIHESVRNVLDDTEKKALDGFSEEEKEQLFSFLSRIKTNLKK